MYLEYLKGNAQMFTTSEGRRRKKAFERLSHAVKKRSPAQCRSLYQKLELRVGRDINKII